MQRERCQYMVFGRNLLRGIIQNQDGVNVHSVVGLKTG